MFASRLVKRAAVFVRRATPLIAVLGTLTLAACGDDGDGDGTGPDGVNGTWEMAGGGFYMEVSSSEITWYIDFAECFLPVVYDVVDIDGNQYTVEVEGEPAGVITLDRIGSNLSVEIDGEEFVLEPSNVDTADLELCDTSGPEENFDPALASCSSYDPLTPGVTDGGTLFTTDATDPNGYYYDAYRLQLAGSSDVEISMTSTQVDPFLYLYSSTGTLIGWDDDTGEGVDALLTATLGAGCYIVVASSYDAGETGSYQIVANAFCCSPAVRSGRAEPCECALTGPEPCSLRVRTIANSCTRPARLNRRITTRTRDF